MKCIEKSRIKGIIKYKYEKMEEYIIDIHSRCTYINTHTYIINICMLNNKYNLFSPSTIKNIWEWATIKSNRDTYWKSFLRICIKHFKTFLGCHMSFSIIVSLQLFNYVNYFCFVSPPFFLFWLSLSSSSSHFLHSFIYLILVILPPISVKLGFRIK